VDREIEAPADYSLTAPGGWDGEPSLGGVWVAHAEVTSPRRVIIRDSATDISVVGSLFRADTDAATTPLRLSRDAAAALDLQQGEIAEISVTALRRAIAGPFDHVPSAEQDTTVTASEQPVSTLPKPFVQIGIFHVQSKANRVVDTLDDLNVPTQIKIGTLNDKPFWRVIAGPARSDETLDALTRTVREAGYSDAYAVTD
jgi:hypothetical protein